MIARLLLTVALLVSSNARAQVTPADARAHADQLIASAGGQKWFENVSEGTRPIIRHTPSGMTCVFQSIDPRNVVRLYETRQGGPAQSDDVGCASWWEDTYVSMIASRYPEPYSDTSLFDAATADITEHWDSVAGLSGEYRFVTLIGQTRPLWAVFSSLRDGRPATQTLVLRNIDGWTFKARGTAYPGDEDTIRKTSLVFAFSLPGGWEQFKLGQSD